MFNMSTESKTGTGGSCLLTSWTDLVFNTKKTIKYINCSI